MSDRLFSLQIWSLLYEDIHYLYKKAISENVDYFLK